MTAHSHPFKIISVPIGAFNFKIAQLENPEILLDDLLSKDPNHPDVIDELIPYWCDLWPSAIALSEFILENPQLVKNKNVIEIGCGLGLPGIVANKAGGKVVLTDYLQEALNFAGHNWKLNFSTEADMHLLNWRNAEDISPFDVVLASDIVYEKKSFQDVINSFKHLIKKDGIILLSEPNRNFSKMFFNKLKDSGFKITEEIRSVLKDGINYKVSVYLIRY